MRWCSLPWLDMAYPWNLRCQNFVATRRRSFLSFCVALVPVVLLFLCVLTALGGLDGYWTGWQCVSIRQYGPALQPGLCAAPWLRESRQVKLAAI